MRVPLAIFAAIVISANAFATTRGFSWDSMVLYQPDEDLRVRIEPQGLADYCKQLEKVCTNHFASETTPERLDIVVGLKPGRKVRVWFVSSRRSSEAPSLIALKKKLEAVPAYSVRNGPVAFALRCSIAGGSPEPKAKGDFQPPMPKEWRDAAVKAKRDLLVPDGMFKQIWPD
ncbi:MAG TPA: hypothetical protein VJ281_03930 [Chthoniobacterales bacterium]|jgi:hypothetical protein|nr:hypothetical protein [Chthoniobacterales bacterium]